MTIQYGKYKGYDLGQVPQNYLEWLLTNNETTAEAIRAELNRREASASADQSVMRQIVEAGYRAMVKKHHPDTGGDHEAMVEVNAAIERLREVVTT